MKVDVPLREKRIDLTRLPWLKRALRSRWPQFILRALALGGFLLAIMTGLLGTPVGSRNFAIVFVWIAWWALLMLSIVPLLGRGWCSICPIPMPGEWLQQGAVLKPKGGGAGLGKRWPNRLRNIWLQNGAFALVALFSTIVLTQPSVSALVLAAFLLIATGTSLIFERRAFCRYLCPVGGFIGLYSQLAPVELRVKNRSVCVEHVERTCYTGSEDGYGCPWQVFPGGMIKNTYCGLCMECLRTCPHDNIALNLRSLGADLEPARGRKLDEAFKAFLMLGSALMYSAVLLGPWGLLKNSAYSIGTPAWLLYALLFLAFVFGVIPGAFWLAVRIGRGLAGGKKKSRGTTMRRDFIQLAYSLVPLGLAAWIAFSLAFVFTNLSYLWPALSDPFGWGWDLFGTAGAAWTPYLAGLMPFLQAGILLAGLGWASRTALKIANQIIAGNGSRLTGKQPVSAALLALPVVVFCLAVTGGLMGLLLA
jgi:polyferredoxin